MHTLSQNAAENLGQAERKTQQWNNNVGSWKESLKARKREIEAEAEKEKTQCDCGKGNCLSYQINSKLGSS